MQNTQLLLVLIAFFKDVAFFVPVCLIFGERWEAKANTPYDWFFSIVVCVMWYFMIQDRFRKYAAASVAATEVMKVTPENEARV